MIQVGTLTINIESARISMRMRVNLSDINSQTERASTRQRRLVLDVLREAEGHLDAKELYRRAAEKDPGVSLATVYRSLRLFKELGLVEEQHLDRAQCYYEIRGSNAHYHMVCTSCGRVLEFDNPLVSQLVAEVEHTADFDVRKVVLYLEGYCSECKSKQQPSQKTE